MQYFSPIATVGPNVNKTLQPHQESSLSNTELFDNTTASDFERHHHNDSIHPQSIVSNRLSHSTTITLNSSANDSDVLNDERRTVEYDDNDVLEEKQEVQSITPYTPSTTEIQNHSSQHHQYTHSTVTEDRTFIPPYSSTLSSTSTSNTNLSGSSFQWTDIQNIPPQHTPVPAASNEGNSAILLIRENLFVVTSSLLLPVLCILAEALFELRIAVIMLSISSVGCHVMELFFVISCTFSSIVITDRDHSIIKGDDEETLWKHTSTVTKGDFKEIGTQTLFRQSPLNRYSPFNSTESIDDDTISTTKPKRRNVSFDLNTEWRGNAAAYEIFKEDDASVGNYWMERSLRDSIRAKNKKTIRFHLTAKDELQNIHSNYVIPTRNTTENMNEMENSYWMNRRNSKSSNPACNALSTSHHAVVGRRRYPHTESDWLIMWVTKHGEVNGEIKWSIHDDCNQIATV